MIGAPAFLREAAARGFRLWSGVPCSYLKPFINCVIDAREALGGDGAGVRWVAAANEGDAVAIASGAELAGTGGVAIFQNSGLGNAVNPLASLNAIFDIPILLVTTLRGDPEGRPDEPQHRLMGRITTSLLETLEIPWDWFPPADSETARVLDHARASMEASGRPFALVLREGGVEPWKLRSRPEPRAPYAAEPPPPAAGERPTRAEILRAVLDATGPRDIVIATTGYTGRELWAQEDRANHLYMVGSMGCAASLGLGIALVRPERRVVVLDGDGALLMRLGALSTIGYERPPNLLHVVLDNEAHESTGGQSTVSHSLDLCGVAAACGYPRTRRIQGAAELARVLRETEPGLAFLHVKTAAGVPPGLPRPTVKPPEVARRLRGLLAREVPVA